MICRGLMCLCGIGVAMFLAGCGLGTPCIGDGSLTCGPGTFCMLDSGSCNDASAVGVCMPTPDTCIEIFQPVCGCDGMTYSNECLAMAAGVSVDQEGECAVAP